MVESLTQTHGSHKTAPKSLASHDNSEEKKFNSKQSAILILKLYNCQLWRELLSNLFGNHLSGKVTIRESSFRETSFRENDHPGKLLSGKRLYSIIIIRE